MKAQGKKRSLERRGKAAGHVRTARGENRIMKRLENKRTYTPWNPAVAFVISARPDHT